MSKYGPFTISTRERSRLAWRQRVDAAAREEHRASVHLRSVRKPPATFRGDYLPALDRYLSAQASSRAALAAPRPWRSQRKPDPRRRYSRSHRRACQRCKRVTYWVAEVKWARKCGRPEYRRFVTRELIHFRRDPHGRRER